MPAYSGTIGDKMLPESRPPDQAACGFWELSARICDILSTGQLFYG
jgi:hypothetical protein